MNIFRKVYAIKSRIFLSWIISYAVILIVPIIIGLYVYYRSIDTINIEVARAHNATIKQFKTIMDGRFEELTMLGSYLSLSSSIQKVMLANQELRVVDRINIIEAQRELSRFQVSKNYLDNIYVYFNRSDTLFTSTFKYGDISKTNTIYEILGMEYYDFQNTATSRLFRDVRIHNGSLIYIQSLYLHDLRSPEGLFIAVFDRRWVDGFLNNMQWIPQARTMLLDGRGSYIGLREVSELPQISGSELLNDASNTFYTSLNGITLAVSNILSDFTKVRYVSAIPIDLYHKSAREIRNIIIIYVAAYLFIGGILSLLFARRNYDPIKKLAGKIAEKFGQSSYKEENEYRLFENSLERLLNRNTTLVENLSKINETVRNEFLQKVLKGKIKTNEKFLELAEMYNFEFISDKNAVVAFTINALGDSTLEKNIVVDEQAMNLVNFTIKNISEEIFLDLGYRCFTTTVDGLTYCIINLGNLTSTTDEKLLDDISDVLQKILVFLDEQFELKANVTLSGVNIGLHGIESSYREVEEMLEYRTFFDISEKIVTVDSIHLTSKSNMEYNSTLDKERQFLNCINVKDFLAAKEIMNEIIAGELENPNLPIQHVKCKMFGLLNLMLNVLGEVKTKSDLEFFVGSDPLRILQSTNSVKKLKLHINTFFDSFIEYIEKKDQSLRPEWLDKVEDYVDKNFTEKDFSIGSLSDSLELNFSYLSRAFKKHKGVGLLDYLHNLRISMAKNLLAQDFSIKEVAERVGYLDSKGLIRAFRRYEGITPGKYKEIE